MYKAQRALFLYVLHGASLFLHIVWCVNENRSFAIVIYCKIKHGKDACHALDISSRAQHESFAVLNFCDIPQSPKTYFYNILRPECVEPSPW